MVRSYVIFFKDSHVNKTVVIYYRSTVLFTWPCVSLHGVNDCAIGSFFCC